MSHIEHLLRIIHLRELRGEHRVHLILLKLMSNLHVGEWQESSREILRCGESALAGVGIKQHLLALRTVIVWQQTFIDHPLTEELSHLRFQHAST